MADNIINLFNENGSGNKYSDLLESFVGPLINKFPKEAPLGYIYEIGVAAWNIACISMTLPKEAKAEVLQLAYNDFPNEPLIKKFIERKFRSFNQYDHIYLGFELEEEGGDIILSVETQSIHDYLQNPEEPDFDLFAGEEEEPGPIDRHAIVLKPKQPLFDWINDIYPEEPINEVDEANIYLVDRDKINDFDSWLKKHFDRLFQMELEEWHFGKKEWPQKRNYKLFNEWFQVDVSTLVMDLENAPVFKGCEIIDEDDEW